MEQKSKYKIEAVEVSYLRHACGVSTVDGESNESVYRKLGMFVKGEGMNCGGV